MAQQEQPRNASTVELAARARALLAMSVDVEAYFQVSAFRHSVSISAWDSMPTRVEGNTLRVLDLFAEFDCKATFFVLGWVAERHPALVRRIQRAGHELGCHSYAHRLIYELTPEEFRADTQRALRAIEDAAGVRVRTYRSPSFSITPRSAWAFAELVDLGFEMDSSIFPIRHDLYGFAAAPRFPFRIPIGGKNLIEFPPPTVRIGWVNFPITGGGYLRRLPLGFQTRMLRRHLQKSGPSLVYFHPWELDPAQPRVAAPLLSRFRHYAGLKRTEARLRKMLSEFRFATLSQTVQASGPLPEFNLLRTGECQYEFQSAPSQLAMS
jgi:polysaccharide deacetylase family protein (PEP-CTERM system associated)